MKFVSFKSVRIRSIIQEIKNKQMSLTRTIIIFTATLAVINALTILDNEKTREEKQKQAVEIITASKPGIAGMVSNIIDAAAGNVHGICWRNSYVVAPEVGTECVEDWEKGGALCYEIC